MPDKIKNAPQLEIGLELYYMAFSELSSCRQMGFDEGPIPWTVVAEYCDRNDIGGEQRAGMFHHIKAMDNVYLEFRSQKAKEQSGRK